MYTEHVIYSIYIKRLDKKTKSNTFAPLLFNITILVLVLNDFQFSCALPTFLCEPFPFMKEGRNFVAWFQCSQNIIILLIWKMFCWHWPFGQIQNLIDVRQVNHSPENMTENLEKVGKISQFRSSHQEVFMPICDFNNVALQLY